MKTTRFRVTYSNGKVAEYESEQETIEAFTRLHFGITADEAKEYGAMVEILATEGA